MPLLKLETTVALADDKKKALLAALSKIVAGTIGKPEQYVMVVIGPACHPHGRQARDPPPLWTSAALED